MHAHWLTLFTAALFSITNPLGNVGVVAGLTSQVSAAKLKKIVFTSAIAILVILLISVWLGKAAMNFFGINLHELRTAGGLIVLIIGLNMLFNNTSHAQTESEKRQSQEQENVAIVPIAIPIVAGPGTITNEIVPGPATMGIAIVPIAIPIVAGPGTISLVIATASKHDAFTDKVSMTLVCVMMTALLWFAFSYAKIIAQKIGPNGMAVVTRVMGMILASIAMGMLATGIKGLFPEIFAAT